MAKPLREIPTVKKIVESMGTKAGEEAFNHLLDTYPEVVHQLINTPATLEFLKIWHSYGLKVQGHARNWAEKYSRATGLAPQGVLAFHALRAAFTGQQWEPYLEELLMLVNSRKLPNGRWMRTGVPLPFAAEKNSV